VIWYLRAEQHNKLNHGCAGLHADKAYRKEKLKQWNDNGRQQHFKSTHYPVFSYKNFA
jgi:hypothetical protein